MAFDAGAITGKILLDLSGFKESHRAALAGTQELGASLEENLGVKAPQASREMADAMDAAGEKIKDTARDAGKLAEELDELTPAGKKATAEFDEMRRKLDSLDDSLSKIDRSAQQSGMAIGGLLRGAGEVAVVTAAARELEKFGTQISELEVKLAKGEISMSDWASESLRSVPVLGDMTKAFDALGGAITGAHVEIERLNAESARMAATSDVIQKLLDMAKEAKGAFSTTPPDIDDDLTGEAQRRHDEVEANRKKRRDELAKQRQSAGGWFSGPESADVLESELKMTDKAAKQAHDSIDSELRAALAKRMNDRAAAAQMDRAAAERQKQDDDRAARQKEQDDARRKALAEYDRAADRGRRAAELADEKKQRDEERERKRADDQRRKNELQSRRAEIRQRIDAVDDELVGLRRAGVKGPGVDALIDERRLLMRQMRDVGQPGQAPTINVNVPGVNQDELAKSIAGHVTPKIEQRVREAEAAAEAVGRRKRVKDGFR